VIVTDSLGNIIFKVNLAEIKGLGSQFGHVEYSSLTSSSKFDLHNGDDPIEEWLCNLQVRARTL
jgi:hypothetical protein